MSYIKPLIIPNNRNLLHWFKHESVSAERINFHLKSNPNTPRDIGTLPFDWLKNSDKNERKQITELVQELFRNFSRLTASVPGRGVMSGWKFVDASKFEDAYGIIVNGLKNILKRDDIRIQYVGSGALKNCHRLDIGEYSYALSCFRDSSVTRKGFGDYLKCGHGRGYEPQNAITAYKRGAQGRWAKPFMVRVSSENDDGGYILSKFIEHQRKSPFGNMQKANDFYINYDESEDVINNINTDFGGCCPNENYMCDKLLKPWRKYFAKMLDNNSMSVNHYSKQRVQKFLLEQKHNGVDILNDDFIKSVNTLFSDEDAKFARKLIKSLKKVRKQKDILISQQKYDLVKDVIQKDLDNVFTFHPDKEMIDTFIDKLKTYPSLVADEMEISNFSVLNSWIKIHKDYNPIFNFTCIENRFTRKDVLNFLDLFYSNIRNEENLLDKLNRFYDIEREIEVLESKYKN